MVAQLVRDPFDREGWLFELEWGTGSGRLPIADTGIAAQDAIPLDRRCTVPKKEPSSITSSICLKLGDVDLRAEPHDPIGIRNVLWME